MTEPTETPSPDYSGPVTPPPRHSLHPPAPVPGTPGQGLPPQYKLSRGRSRIWRMLGVTALIGFVGFSGLSALIYVGGAGLFGGGQKDPYGVAEFRRESGGEARIAVIPVTGIIMDSSSGGMFGGGVNTVNLIRDGLDRAAADENVKAVIIEVNSPGGGVTASDHIHHEIVKFQKESGKPVVVYMKDLAASGGYYISAPCDHIVANHTTLTGSIGVIMQNFNLHGTLTKILKGRDTTIKAGGNKSMGSMFADPDSEEYKVGRALLQELVDDMHVKFKKLVKEGRGGKLSADWETYADGRIMTAETAMRIGLIDEIGYFEDAIAAAERLSGASNCTVVQYGRRVTLATLLGLEAGDAKLYAEAVNKAAPALAADSLGNKLQEVMKLYPDRPLVLWVP